MNWSHLPTPSAEIPRRFLNHRYADIQFGMHTQSTTGAARSANAEWESLKSHCDQCGSENVFQGIGGICFQPTTSGLWFRCFCFLYPLIMSCGSISCCCLHLCRCPRLHWPNMVTSAVLRKASGCLRCSDCCSASVPSGRCQTGH